MPVFDSEFTVEAPIATVREFHASTDALRLLSPPGSRVRVHDGGPLAEGLIVRFTMWLGPLPVHWVALHENVGPDGFVDVMVEGPMASWRHTHRFVATGEATAEVHDHIEYEHPPGLAGVRTRILFGRPALGVLFAHRRRATRAACAGPGASRQF